MFDVTIIGRTGGDKPRQTCNPNVLFELGYALATHADDQVVLVANRAYGGPEELPFDIKGRYLHSYSLTEREEKAEPRRNLRKSLMEALKAGILRHDAMVTAFSDRTLGRMRQVYQV